MKRTTVDRPLELFKPDFQIISEDTFANKSLRFIPLNCRFLTFELLERTLSIDISIPKYECPLQETGHYMTSVVIAGHVFCVNILLDQSI